MAKTRATSKQVRRSTPEADILEELRRELEQVTSLVTIPGHFDEVLERSLTILVGLVPTDLALALGLREGRLRALSCRKGGEPEVWDQDLLVSRSDLLERVVETCRSYKTDTEELRAENLSVLIEQSAASSPACAIVPLLAGEDCLGILVVTHEDPRAFNEAGIDQLSLVARLIGTALMAARQAAELEQANRILEQRAMALGLELQARSWASPGSDDSVRSPAMREVYEVIRQVAGTDTPVLILGETGVGKERLARLVHEWSPRRNQAFVTVNCAALPSELIESELFGYVKGAFTGAVQDRPGRFLAADRGTLLLDEIGDMPLELQAKLLRVLQEGAFEQVGSDERISVDVRVMAATHRDLVALVERGEFREDLLYRLNVFPVQVPALRDRKEDIPLLVCGILDEIHERTGEGPWVVRPEQMERLVEYDWPGNIRELINVLERSRILSRGSELEVQLGETELARDPLPRAWPTLEELEQHYLRQVLRRTRGKVYGEGGAAELLDLRPTTLQSRLKRHGIDRASFES